ncbi:MAG: 4Fe-4S binding protein [Actinobacteria bacterium]|nr:4Fe-4S binding protein [Actinomycetota bacterium]
MLVVIVILTAIGVVCGIIIYVVNRVLPPEDEALKKTEEISNCLPGMNCGACGYPGCFAYAQALAKNPELISESTCATVLQNQEMLEGLGSALGIKLNPSIGKKALVYCTGDTRVLGDYSGAKSCKAASRYVGGTKKCPYGCLGFGDCVEVCPEGAIHMDKERNIAVIDPEKCNGCGLCVKECPKNIIKLVPANTKIAFLCSYDSLKDIPGREKCDRGCIHCRKCYKACEYEAIVWNKEKAIPEFDIEKCTLCGACVKACPQNTLTEFSNILRKVPV